MLPNLRHQTLPFVSGSNVAQTGIKLNTQDSLQLLIQLSGAREYMCVSYIVCVIMGIEPRMLHMLGKSPTNRQASSELFRTETLRRGEARLWALIRLIAPNLFKRCVWHTPGEPEASGWLQILS